MQIRGVSENIVQCTIDGGEKGRDGEFKRDGRGKQDARGVE
jgi:hypothetical protein